MNKCINYTELLGNFRTVKISTTLNLPTYSFLLMTQFSSVQLLSHVQLFSTPWIAARQASLSITNSWSSLRLNVHRVRHHTAISSSVVPFSSCPQSLPASESFPMSQFFSWGGQSTGVSALASFLPCGSQKVFLLLLLLLFFNKTPRNYLQHIQLWQHKPHIH